MLFNFQGPCTFNKFFVCFSSALFILPHSKAFVKTFFKLFFKKFFELFVNSQFRNQSVLYSLFTLFLTKKPLEYWLFKPLLFKFFTALSRQLHYVTTLYEECQHFFEFFSFFLRFFYFHFSLPIYRIFSISFI